MSNFNLQGDFFSLKISNKAKVSLGEPVTLSNFLSIEVGADAQLTIGNRVFFNDHCTLRCLHKITIGRDTMFGDGVRLYDFDHIYNNYRVEQFEFTYAPITVGKNCWIGANTIILKGTTIGDNVIIGAGCTIRGEVPDNVIVVNDCGSIRYIQRPQGKHHAFTYTASGSLEHIEYLIKSLPQLEFHIAAPTRVSANLRVLEQFPNVSIYTQIHHLEIIHELLDRADIYLDINNLYEVSNVVGLALERSIPVFGFDNVVHRPEQSTVFPSDAQQEMVNAILQQLELKESEN